MMPLEMAMKLASSSSRCERHKCPFMAQCKGDYTTCVMKEIALMLRSQNAEIETLKSMVKAFSDVLASVQIYIADLEKINKRYHDLVIAFEQGYRPKKHVKRPYKPRKKSVEEMDGDERYACSPPTATEPPPPVVMI